MRFGIGDLLVYGETGVCRVDEIVVKPFLDGERECYKLSPLYSSCAIFTPTDNGNVFMRPVITRDEADSLIEGIPLTEPADCTASSPRELSEKYDRIIKLHDCRALVSLTRAIHEKRERLVTQKKKLSAIDERFLKKAEDLLFGELAAVLEIKKLDVMPYIESKIGQ